MSTITEREDRISAIVSGPAGPVKLNHVEHFIKEMFLDIDGGTHRIACVYQMNRGSKTLWLNKEGHKKRLAEMIADADIVTFYDKTNDIKHLQEAGIDIDPRKVLDIQYVLNILLGRKYSLDEICRILGIGKKYRRKGNMKSDFQRQCLTDILLIKKLTECLKSGDLSRKMSGAIMP